MKVIILTTQYGNWVGLFVDGELINEGHKLGDGDEFYFIKQAEKRGLKVRDIKRFEITDEDEILLDGGNFPKKMSEFSGEYK